MTSGPDLSALTKAEIVGVLNEVRHPVDIAIYASGNYFNIAGIIRTAHSFLIRKIYLVDVEHPKDSFYEKGTMGSHKYENIVNIDLDNFLKEVKEHHRNVVAFERRPGILTTTSSWTFVYPKDPILVFGSEKNGVPDEIIKVSKSVISIPMFGLNNDLNIAHSASIAMYDWISKFYSNRH